MTPVTKTRGLLRALGRGQLIHVDRVCVYKYDQMAPPRRLFLATQLQCEIDKILSHTPPLRFNDPGRFGRNGRIHALVDNNRVNAPVASTSA